MKGRRRPDTKRGRLPRNVRRGDYWKVLEEGTCQPAKLDHPSNLTGSEWMVAAPIGEAEGFAIGRLAMHTVREHEDRTISVRPGDGSSNSILITGAHGATFHGYIEHGEWSGV